jgi:hypothetical protein
MQICKKCGVTKPIADFEWQKNRPNPRKVCKICRYTERDLEKEKHRHREYMRERRKTNPDVVRQNWERCTYGVCKEDMGVASCMICGDTHRLCIDHCHSSGAVRGILCGRCNSGLGMFRDDIARLKAAIEYLNKGPHFQIEGV